jgi:hypothetical protein
MATGHPMSLELCQSRTRQTGRASPCCTAIARIDTSARRRGWQERLIILILNFCVTNLFNSVVWRKHTRIEPHYFDVWELAHQGNPDAAETLVTISFYSYTIFVIFILNSIFCRTAIQRS